MNETKSTRAVVLTNPQGLHARPADLFVRTANRFDAHVQIVKDGRRVNGKSILDILTLAVEQGTNLVLEATGPDAEAALDALVALVEQDFAEGEQRHNKP
jgi:phosphotransferase system HPr (HPr) family protein